MEIATSAFDYLESREYTTLTSPQMLTAFISRRRYEKVSK